jgi:hypothetical protein
LVSVSFAFLSQKKEKEMEKSNTNLLFKSSIKESLAALTGLCLLNTCSRPMALPWAIIYLKPVIITASYTSTRCARSVTLCGCTCKLLQQIMVTELAEV